MLPRPTLHGRDALAIVAVIGIGGGLAGGIGCGGDSAPPVVPSSVCGDGVVSGNELCDDGENDLLGGGCFPGCQAQDRSGELFSKDLLSISIETKSSDWETLRLERKSRHTTFLGADCRDHPAANPYSFIESVVTIDGTTLTGVGIRKKGHLGSQSTIKPSLKLNFSEYQTGQTYSSLRRIALNNSRSDPSHLRTCLAYSMFAAVGIPTPRCTFAHVTVNGDDLGVFVAVEEIRNPFLARHFSDPSGTLYEGTACDFRDEFIGGFEQETNTNSSPDRSDIGAVLAAVSNPAPGLAARLEPLIDLDDFYRFWATEVLVSHRDGYAGNANNFFLYADPARDDRFRFVPWGPDAAFRPENRSTVPANVYAFSAVTNGLYAEAESRTAYLAALAEVRQSFDPDALVAEADRIAAVIEPKLRPVDRAVFANDLVALKDSISARNADIDAALASGPPDWTAGLRSLPCRVPVTQVSMGFTTTWDSLSEGLFTTGEATIELTLDGQPVTLSRSGARAGTLASGLDRVQLGFDSQDQRRFTVTATLSDPRFFDPFLLVGTHPLVSPPINVVVNESDISTTPAVITRRFDVGEGQWTWTQIDTSLGAEISGTFAGTLYAR